MAYVNLGQAIYPVGSIYMSTKNISPGNMFGGGWEEIKDERFWLTVPLTKTTGQTGGEATHKLTTSEMPRHFHKTRGYWSGTSYAGQSYKFQSYDYQSGDKQGNNCEYEGGSQPHNNMPPYRTCYSWIRTS